MLSSGIKRLKRPSIEMKEVMSICPILAFPDFSKPFIVECDASGGGVGDVLKQGQHPISFESKKLHPHKNIYSIYSLTFSDMIFGDSRAPKAKYWVEESQEILKLLKDNFQVSQNQQKQYADKHREEGPLRFMI